MSTNTNDLPELPPPSISVNSNGLPELPSLKKPARPWDLINPEIGRVSSEVKAARLDACQNCKFFFKLSRQCRKCGCFMDAKAGLPHAECPIGKWGMIKDV